jgi:uncharacterized membrane protein
MKQFTFLADTSIGWDIIGLYVVCSIISLVIFYNIIKAAVKNGIIEARSHKETATNSSYSKPERPANSEQAKLQQRSDKGEITFEEYKEEWNKLST